MGWVAEGLAALAASPSASTKTHALRQQIVKQPLISLQSHMHHQGRLPPSQQHQEQQQHGMPASTLISDFEVSLATRGAGGDGSSSVSAAAAARGGSPNTTAALEAFSVGMAVNGNMDEFRTSMGMPCTLHEAAVAAGNNGYSRGGETASPPVWTTVRQHDRSNVSGMSSSSPRSSSPSQAYFSSSAGGSGPLHDSETDGGWGSTGSGQGGGGGGGVVGQGGTSFLEGSAVSTAVSRARDSFRMKESSGSAWDGGGGAALQGLQGGQQLSGAAVTFEPENSVWTSADYSI